jgi:hypothetical protein
VFSQDGWSLGEGIGDLVAMYSSGQPVIGEAFKGSGTWIRNYDVPVATGGSMDRKWPAHECLPSNNWPHDEHCVGETFGGFVWDLRKNMIASLGSAVGVAAAENASLGALPTNDSTIPDAVLRTFLKDDVDGKLWNGTPHFADVIHAACAHAFDSTVIPGLPVLLQAAPASVSSAGGGSISIALDACPGLSGRIYFTLISASGIDPGLPFLGVTVPLNFDAFTSLGIEFPNTVIFQHTLGLLDAQGKATSTVVVPPGIVPAGTTLSFASVIFPGLTAGAAASVPASVAIQ